jgi:hypothetical protein
MGSQLVPRLWLGAPMRYDTVHFAAALTYFLPGLSPSIIRVIPLA